MYLFCYSLNRIKGFWCKLSRVNQLNEFPAQRSHYTAAVSFQPNNKELISQMTQSKWCQENHAAFVEPISLHRFISLSRFYPLEPVEQLISSSSKRFSCPFNTLSPKNW